MADTKNSERRETIKDMLGTYDPAFDRQWWTKQFNAVVSRVNQLAKEIDALKKRELDADDV